MYWAYFTEQYPAYFVPVYETPYFNYPLSSVLDVPKIKSEFPQTFSTDKEIQIPEIPKINSDGYLNKKFADQIIPLQKKIKKNQIEKKNVRNIIPNLSRKLINYLASSQGSIQLKAICPDLTDQELQKYREHVIEFKKHLNYYIGNKNLKELWYPESSSHQYCRYNRMLSQHFLNQICANSILCSKKMKNSLKFDHLRYRRKLLKLLQSPQNDLY